MTKTKEIPLDKIRLVEGVQQREKIDQGHVGDLADALRDGAKLPPGRVRFDGTDYVLSRGFHRYLAHKRLQFASMPCEVVDGSVRDAVLDAIGTNDDHGLKRSNADKRKEVTTLLSDDEWGGKSDNWISETAKVSDTLVATVRKELSASGQLPEKEVREGKDGKKRRASQTSSKNADPPKSADPVDVSGWDDPADAVEQAEEAVASDPVVSFYEGEPADDGKPAKDNVGGEVPKKLKPSFENRPWFRHFVNRLGQLLKECDEQSKWPGGELLPMVRIRADLRNAQNEVKNSCPHAVCPHCRGKGCDQCHDLGWMTSERYGAVPKEKRGA